MTAARKGAELVAAFERRGAVVLHGPTLSAEQPSPDLEIVADTDIVLDQRPEWVVASTGVGMRLWAAVAERHGRGPALATYLGEARCVARGAKAVGGLQSFGIRPLWVSAKETDADVAAWLHRRMLNGERVAVQFHGAPTRAFERLGESGHEILSVQPYRCGLPLDLSPAHRLLDAALDGALDLLVFTSAGAARNLLEIARAREVEQRLLVALTGPVGVAVVGPVTAAVFEEAGVPVAVAPRRSRMGELVRAVTAWEMRRRAGGTTVATGLRFWPDRSAVRVDEHEIPLGVREYAILAALARRPGVVCRPSDLTAEAWGHDAPADAAIVKHQVSRLRRKLGASSVAIETVRGVGYRLVGDVRVAP